MSCTSCAIYHNLDQLSKTYGREVFDAIAPQCHKLFTTFLALWLLWQLGVNWLYRGEIDKEETFKTFLVFLLVGLFLKGSGYYWDYFYEPTSEVISKLTQAVITVSGHAGGGSIKKMLEVVENELSRIFDLQKMISADASWYQVPTMIGGLILCLPYVFIWGIFLAYTLEGIFKLLAVTALAPIFIVCTAFPSTRAFTYAAGRIILNGGLTVVFAGVAMGFTLSVLKHYIATIPMNEGGMVAGAAAWVFSKDYWHLFLIGFISILFHLKASTIASNISGSSDGPGAAGAVVGAAMMAAGVSKTIGMRGGAKVAKFAGQKADSVLKAAKAGPYAFRDRSSL